MYGDMKGVIYLVLVRVVYEGKEKILNDIKRCSKKYGTI